MHGVLAVPDLWTAGNSVDTSRLHIVADTTLWHLWPGLIVVCDPPAPPPPPLLTDSIYYLDTNHDCAPVLTDCGMLVGQLAACMAGDQETTEHTLTACRFLAIALHLPLQCIGPVQNEGGIEADLHEILVCHPVLSVTSPLRLVYWSAIRASWSVRCGRQIHNSKRTPILGPFPKHMDQDPHKFGSAPHPRASSGFRFSLPYLLVMSTTTLSCGTIIALIPDFENSLKYCLGRGLCQFAEV